VTGERLSKTDELIRLIAFYLPQFHPIPENSKWWGPGFTEWNNVAKAKPLFRGHYQPHLPADLGFYDLRLPEVRKEQANLARVHGIYGFCYYHFWFAGRRLLGRPLDEVLASGEPDFPFCLCWANEPWTRVWDGGEKNVLMPQSYSPEDDLNHIRWLIEVFRDDRYIRIDGRPLLLVYRPSLLPNTKQTAEIWRQEAARAGIAEPFLAQVEHFAADRRDPRAVGFDTSVEFQPDGRHVGRAQRIRLPRRILRRLHLTNSPFAKHSVFDYGELVNRSLNAPDPRYPRIRCVTPMWDNSSRRQSGAWIFNGSTPQLYEKWLTGTMLKELLNPTGNGFVFVNAWNEWAEGNHLEPCQRWGRSYLEATSASRHKVRLQKKLGLAPEGEIQLPGGLGDEAEALLPGEQHGS
jgi:lipopolysaccharide biosynthesis protein